MLMQNRSVESMAFKTNATDNRFFSPNPQSTIRTPQFRS